MITRIEIDGFKSFSEFALDLQPFQVLIGENGVGKSNLFDAIVLLSDLVSGDTLYEAFRKNRGDILELFTLYPDGQRAERMIFGVEMLIAKTAIDEFGVTAEASSSRVRYELQIERRIEAGGLGRLYVTRENLEAITEDHDRWFKLIPVGQRKYWIKRGRRAPYLSTDQGIISKHQDQRKGSKQETPIGRIERTILGSVNTAEYPTAYIVRREMMNWRFLQFNPERLRQASDIYESKDHLLPDGSNLPNVLYRMFVDPATHAQVALDIANMIKGIIDVNVEVLSEKQAYRITAETDDGNSLSSQVMSDGTLRVLALVALKNDPQQTGVLCFEEPENGVHPERLEQMIELLKALAVDFDQEAIDNFAPRQILINTHSPKLLSFIEPKNCLFVFSTHQYQNRTLPKPIR